MPLDDYIEKRIISKRFILALLIIGYFITTGNGGELAGAVMGYYFVSHSMATQKA